MMAEKRRNRQTDCKPQCQWLMADYSSQYLGHVAKQMIQYIRHIDRTTHCNSDNKKCEREHREADFPRRPARDHSAKHSHEYLHLGRPLGPVNMASDRSFAAYIRAPFTTLFDTLWQVHSEQDRWNFRRTCIGRFYLNTMLASLRWGLRLSVEAKRLRVKSREIGAI